MATNLSCRKKLDGLIVVSNQWSVLTRFRQLDLKSSASKVLRESNFKGVRFKTKFVHRLFIGYYGSFWVTLAFENKFAATFSKKSKQVIQKVVHDCFKTTKSGRITYQQNFDNMKTLLRNFVSEVYLIVSKLGQDIPFSAINDYEDFFDFKRASQLIVHYAVDFQEQACALFFAKKDVESLMGYKNLKKDMEYYVCLLHGAGNFYFNMDTNMSTQPGTFLREVKFYSEVFKTCHNTMMFRRAEICDLLMDPRDIADDELVKPISRGRKFKSLQQYLNDIRSIQNFIANMNDPDFNLSARYEVIIRLVPIKTCYSKEVNPILQPHRTITKLFKEHGILNLHNVGKCLIKQSPEQLKKHLEKNVVPFLTTLEVYIGSRIRALQGNVYNLFTPQMYLNCMSAEAVTSFCIYGNCNRRNGTRMYPTWLQDKLQLRIKDFSSTSPEVVSDWRFKRVEKKFLTEYEVDENYTVTTLNFIGIECLFKADIQGCLLNNPNFKLASGLRLPLYEIHKRAQMRGTIFYDRIGMGRQRRVLINRVIKVIVHLSFNHFLKRCASKSKTHNQLRQIFKRCVNSTQTELYSTQRFITDIVKRENEDFLFVSWLWELLVYIDPPQAETFRSQLRHRIEETLYQAGVFLGIPRHDQPFKYSLVVPFEGSDKVSFRTLPQETQKKICDNLHQHFFACQGSDISSILKGQNPNVKTLEDFLSMF